MGLRPGQIKYLGGTEWNSCYVNMGNWFALEAIKCSYYLSAPPQKKIVELLATSLVFLLKTDGQQPKVIVT